MQGDPITKDRVNMCLNGPNLSETWWKGDFLYFDFMSPSISNRPILIPPYQTSFVTIENVRVQILACGYVDRLLIIVAPDRSYSLGTHVVWGVMNVLEGQAIFSMDMMCVRPSVSQ